MTGLCAAREKLLLDDAVGGRAFGRALAELVDAELVRASAALGEPSAWALVALGSYARRELSPGSDVDVMLLHDAGRRTVRGQVGEAGRLWYPLWDAGFVLGHSVRTVREATDLADADLDAMTALLDMRVVVGDVELVGALESAVRRLAPKRRARLVRRFGLVSPRRPLAAANPGGCGQRPSVSPHMTGF